MDVLIIETGNGGDLLLTGSDLEVVNGYENMAYLSMFSGADWWANDLITEPTQRVQCLTEVALLENALSSAGRLKIIDAIKNDLSFFKDMTGAEINVDANIANSDRLDISININGQEVYMNWQPSLAYLNYKV